MVIEERGFTKLASLPNSGRLQIYGIVRELIERRRERTETVQSKR